MSNNRTSAIKKKRGLSARPQIVIRPKKTTRVARRVFYKLDSTEKLALSPNSSKIRFMKVFFAFSMFWGNPLFYDKMVFKTHHDGQARGVGKAAATTVIIGLSVSTTHPPEHSPRSNYALSVSGSGSHRALPPPPPVSQILGVHSLLQTISDQTIYLDWFCC